MRVLALSDVHSGTEMASKLAKQAGKVDYAIFLGDLTNYGDKKALEIINSVGAEKNLAIPGNLDSWEILDEIEKEGVSLHMKSVEIAGFNFVGCGGGLHNNPGQVLYSEKEIFEKIVPLMGSGKSVLVTHLPPLNTEIDLAGNGVHIGSAAVRELIEKFQPVLHLCGHAHKAMGETIIGKTRCINAGPTKEGNGLLLELGKTIEVTRLRV